MECTHLDQVKEVTPSANGCEDCLRIGGVWVHLRLCMTCGHVGCCDSSPNKHATKHFHTTRHPIIKSFQPGEEWGWCYVDEVMFDELLIKRSQPVNSDKSSKQRNLAWAVTILMLLVLPFSVLAQGAPRRVRFQSGHSSATLKGRIVGFDTKDYVVGAKAGQVMDLHLSSSNQSTYFVIYSINGRATDMNETTVWSENLSESGDYLIRVFMMRSAARRKGAAANFSLSVSIK
jgi:hypothetical protein